MLTVGLVGSSGAGKTALAEQLIPLLSARGLRVAYLKHAHAGYEAARPGADSWRAREAGALTVGVLGPAGFMLEGDGDDEAEDLIARMPTGDLVLLEGWSSASWPKVVVRSPSVPDRDVAPPIMTTIESDPPGQFGQTDLTTLADRLAALVPERGEPEVTLSVDGRVLSLGEFPASVVANTMWGLISALKDVGEPGAVGLRIRYPTLSSRRPPPARSEGRRA
jgi:molybdopterin-guanine dinucleotide biosynthesis protein B